MMRNASVNRLIVALGRVILGSRCGRRSEREVSILEST
jgi:hypothetical protein